RRQQKRLVAAERNELRHDQQIRRFQAARESDRLLGHFQALRLRKATRKMRRNNKVVPFHRPRFR
ncbi:hypothetical protein, partial [Falsiroseomonas selenitidurans]|uniref:hypothetical protein n=1 Tax=Falsiroseomonas selenitidurans TaxID=2716335 RepID=UPI001ADE9A4B